MHAVITPDIAANLHLVGDRWTLLILRDLFLGRHRFDSLQAHTGAGRATLSRRLTSLIEAELVKKIPYGKGRFEYHLTTKSRGLYPAALCAWSWEQRFAEAAAELPEVLLHDACGKPMRPKAVCHHCQQPIKREDVKLVEGSTFQQQVAQMGSANAQRRRQITRPGEDHSMTQIAEIVGDRWSILVLVAMFFGVSKYDDFLRLLGIATNILGERLNLLQRGEIINKLPYQHNPVRYQYLLTERGEALFAFVIVVWQWARSWAGDMSESDVLVHSCGHGLSVDVVCSECGECP